MKLLIVDDEPSILEMVENRMRREGFSTFTASTAEAAHQLYKRVKPDLLLLDIMLPNRSGFDLCRAVRKDGNTPIIFVSARASEQDRIKGLELGADDYIVKPFHLSELVARIRAVLRRTMPDARLEKVETKDLQIDPTTHEVSFQGETLNLPPKEFALLYFLASHPGQVFSRDVLLDRVWGKDAYVTHRTVDVHIRWLRKRIEKDAENPQRLITIRGIGYKFVE